MNNKTIKHVSDADCPKCGFPETVLTRNAETAELLAAECSAGCGWVRSYRAAPRPPAGWQTDAGCRCSGQELAKQGFPPGSYTHHHTCPKSANFRP